MFKVFTEATYLMTSHPNVHISIDRDTISMSVTLNNTEILSVTK